VRVGVLICGDLWEPALARELVDQVDLLCVPAKTTVPTDRYTEYARRLWWNLALTRAMENALPIVVSDWAEARHEAAALADGTKVRSVHHTSGGASINDPGRRPRFNEIQQVLPRGEPGLLAATIDLDAVARFRDYRRSMGLLP
jgi:predicted amidohydrolase